METFRSSGGGAARKYCHGNIPLNVRQCRLNMRWRSQRGRLQILNTRLKILVILLAMLGMACGTNSVVGKWRATRAYDFHGQTWTDVQQEALVELSSDGRFKVTLPGEQRTGEYVLDESVTPHRFIANDSAKK